MFYSHTFLAKKSPLGTVWIAAHLERRIKKHQLDEIDIPSYADCIMFPEVPIALRLSGHLLYGLVRIYSLKVKYLVQDCNRMVDDIRTVFTSVQVNLPADADRAAFESVTLPNTFDLDAVDLEDYQIDGDDGHHKTYDQITIQDHIPFEGEQYVSIFINEDNRTNSSPNPDTSNLGAEPMEEDIQPPFEGQLGAVATPNENGMGGRDLGPIYPMEDDVLPPFEDELGDVITPSENVEGGRDHALNQTDIPVHGHNEGQFSDELPEVRRDAVHNSEPDWGDTINDFAGVHEQSVPFLNRNENLSPIMEGLSVSGEGYFPSPARDKMPTVASADDLDFLNTGISLGQHLPDVELQPTPPVNQPTRKKRKRKQFFDQSIVLTNAEVKQNLNDTSALVSKRRKLPCSALDVWRHNRSRQNERILHESLLSGTCTNLQEVFEKRIPPISESASFEASSGHHTDAAEVGHHTDAAEVGPVSPDMEMEPERPRFATHAEEVMHDLLQSSPGREDFTPSVAKNLGSASDKGTVYEPEVLPTFDNPPSAEPVGSELATPSVNLGDQLHLDESNLGDFPGLQNSADIEELTFLEASNASSGYDITEVGSMSTTTRKVAQYLKDLSPTAHTPEDPSGTLSLNRILERKTRKQCARMFFETLVLKSYGLIDVQQEEAYGDILITRTPALSSVKF